jgi:hypothetical protein
MKKNLIILALFFGFVACGSDDNDSPSPTNDIFMKATVGSQTLDVTGPGSPTDTRGAGGIFDKDNTTLYINGNNGAILISLTIEDFNKTTGSFTLGDVNSGKIGAYTDNSNTSSPVYYYSTSGTLTITKFDGKTMEGTFSFKSYNTNLKKEVIVSGGQFKVPFEEI